jgi:hypothetical protein
MQFNYNNPNKGQTGLLSGMSQAETPEEYQAYRQQMQQAQALQYAQLDPFQRATMAMYQGGSQLGDALGGLLGAKDPALQRMSMRESLNKTVDPTSYESLLQGAQQMQSQGFADDAQTLIGRAQTLKANTLKLNQAQAQEDARISVLAKDQDIQRVLKGLSPDATPEEINTALLPYMGSTERLDVAKLKQEATKASKRTDAVSSILKSQYSALPEDVKAYVMGDEKLQNSLLAAAVQDERAKKLAIEKATQAARSGGGAGAGADGEDGADSVKFTKKQMDLSQQNLRGAQEGLSVLADIKTYLGQATGSGAGAMVDSAAGFFGKSTEGAKATARLKVLSNKLLMGVPRFEGPQSDRDTATYKEAAGQLGDPNIPNDIRMEAWETIKKLLQNQADMESARLQRGGLSLGNGAPPPNAPAGAGRSGNTPRSNFPGGRGIGSFGG